MAQGTGKARNYEQNRKKKSTTKMIIFGVEIVLILIMVGVLIYVTTKTGDGPKVAELDPENLGISDTVLEEQSKLADGSGENTTAETGVKTTGYMNVALFGLDATSESQLYKGSRSDSIMICSVNMDTGDIKLVSVYRDTYLNIGTDEYTKCNAAYFYGGAEQAIKMLNMNLDLDITNFVAVNYTALIDLVDGLNGIYVDVDSQELQHINNYQITIKNDFGLSSYTPVTQTGYQLLDGLQAAAYCRIRYKTGSDYARAASQREVIQAIEEKAKATDIATLVNLFPDIYSEIYTSFTSDDLLTLVQNIGNYRIVDEGGFPEESMRGSGSIGAKGDCVVPLDLEDNVTWLHEFLFDETDYTPSTTVQECSAKVESDTSKYKIHQ